MEHQYLYLLLSLGKYVCVCLCVACMRVCMLSNTYDAYCNEDIFNNYRSVILMTKVTKDTISKRVAMFYYMYCNVLLYVNACI